ncbi:MAG: isopentenyl-diphosphate Delta-isomerase [Corynebacterium sp.]|uniref:isopentenyl-diphosphate Delta-isomerase n=1 Tax=Corynebacterium sp. TaxID=1720 RepID=UPI0026F888B2|nr:isopentenyl-diphosphate Delta-isomerase [Corynebacterium sp.]
MTELVVLADSQGRPAGTAPKAEIHTADTPLHFAFSAYLLDAEGRLLMTRRALSKKTWPGVWTNSFCGHPGPDEANEDAVRRRAAEEVGIDPADLGEVKPVLPDFKYRAVDSSGVVENEICPVFIVTLAEGATFTPNPDEIDSHDWLTVEELFAAVDAAPFAFSPWLVEELADQRLRVGLKASRT